MSIAASRESDSLLALVLSEKDVALQRVMDETYLQIGSIRDVLQSAVKNGIVQWTDKAAGITSIRLTEREEQVVRLVAKGLSNKVLAHELNVSDVAVKNHMRTLIKKLGVLNRTQVALWAIKHGYA